MSFKHTLTYRYNDGSQTLNYPVTEENEGERNVDRDVADAATNLQIDYAAVRARMKMFFMVSDQALTVKTNSSSTPDDTITLVAGVPYLWHDTGPAANPFAADITTLYVTNASGSSAAFKIRSIFDVTP